MPQTKEQKKNTLGKITESFDKQKSMVFVNYKGLKASDLFNLRKALKNAGCKIIVAKKTLLDIALKDKKINFNIKDLEGQIALIFGFEDEISPVKTSYNFSKQNENLKILAGYFENNVIDSNEVIALAQIPSRQELLAKVVSSIFSPVSGFVNVLQGNIRSLVYTISQIKQS